MVSAKKGKFCKLFGDKIVDNSQNNYTSVFFLRIRGSTKIRPCVDPHLDPHTKKFLDPHWIRTILLGSARGSALFTKILWIRTGSALKKILWIRSGSALKNSVDPHWIRKKNTGKHFTYFSNLI